jgi:hypothetical protein
MLDRKNYFELSDDMEHDIYDSLSGIILLNLFVEDVGKYNGFTKAYSENQVEYTFDFLLDLISSSISGISSGWSALHSKMCNEFVRQDLDEFPETLTGDDVESVNDLISSMGK